jgi:hypothetical protein
MQKYVVNKSNYIKLKNDLENMIATSEEIDAELDKQLGEVAQSIVAMPQFPIDSKITSSAEVKPDA